MISLTLKAGYCDIGLTLSVFGRQTKLAEAGFHFEPGEESDDNAICIYCRRTLGGWEKGDDPM